MSYDYQKIEQKWQEYWLQNNTFQAPDKAKKGRKYILDMFPYPSAEGLHVGHPMGYTGSDVLARFWRHQGFSVLHPMGWDAFGLPAENYAIKTKIAPRESTMSNIKNFRRQLRAFGFSYEWDREIVTCEPDYYRWTQWFFSFLYKNNLAYRSTAPVNWCDSCQTVLANEQVVNGACERCKTMVSQKELVQWFFRITDFIQDQGETSGLISGLQKIDWPESTKIAQSNWIGRQEGINITYDIVDSTEKITVFTKYPETNFGATFVVIAPEHEMVDSLTTSTQRDKVEKYRQRTKNMTALERKLSRDKTGAFTGSYAFNPLNQKRMPIYLADFVLLEYGTGIVVAVPGHDKRDFEFAQEHQLEIMRIIKSPDGDSSDITSLEQVGHDGTMINSDFLDGLNAQTQAKDKMIDYLIEKNMGKRIVFYNLRDWLISRQRYWGAPIPIVYDDQGDHYLLPDDELPVELPTDVDFVPKGESPIAKSKSFHDKKELERLTKKMQENGDLPTNRHLVRRESDTMDTFVCSSWYMWRFVDPHNQEVFADKEKLKKWGAMDMYIGGAEHTVLHLLYARFFTKALHKHGYLDYDEPFTRLRHPGMVMGEDGQKMSKSIGNVISPDLVIKKMGADTIRCYEMFMGPFAQRRPWSMGGAEGMHRFLSRVWSLSKKEITDSDSTATGKTMMHQAIKSVTKDIENMHFNTAIAQLIIWNNFLVKEESIPRIAIENMSILLSPFAPHLAEEIWSEVLGNSESITYAPWPVWDENCLLHQESTYAVQINGKVRAELILPIGSSEKEATTQAQKIPRIANHLTTKKIIRVIFVPEKIINFVIT